MKGKITLLALAMALAILFGCTMDAQSPEELVKANGTAQAFMAAHPNAQVSYTHFGRAEFGSIRAEMSADCGTAVAAKEVYKVEISDAAKRQSLVMWLDWEKRIVECLAEKQAKPEKPAENRCLEGWVCKNSMHVAYRNADCSWGRETDCDFGCDKGGCRADPCANIKCDNYCSENTLFSGGKCAKGECSYGQSDCNGVCEGGICKDDLCKGVKCTDKCEAGTRKYGGQCVEGKCEYSSEECKLGCYNNVCRSAGTVFVTSTTSDGRLDGISGADAMCMARAKAAKLSGTWRAMISDKDHALSDWLPNVAYRKLDGMLIAKNKADLLDGTILSPINLTEFGKETASFMVWTGTSSNGEPWGGPINAYCTNWTSADLDRFVAAGSSIRTDERWMNYGSELCYRKASLYCVLVS